MESCALPMEAPREVTTLWPVACSYRGISWSLAAEKPPEVTTRISSAAAVEGVAAPRARPRPRLRAPPSSAPRVRRRRVDGTEDCRGVERMAVMVCLLVFYGWGIAAEAAEAAKASEGDQSAGIFLSRVMRPPLGCSAAVNWPRFSRVAGAGGWPWLRGVVRPS